ncbi:uncharacterized protein BDZ99DRAFT_94347 [Mytilinidion resinicola]|uniref:Uncharacterized protein n=1 Tax=Mytilinidion resinicola TaxID=574789 RepID=A0A6A6YEU3_9PEZI|nr:uncharacterized protein BDZ99DRAFT_94347 [Mytilinidion resinicola]KAF2806377.1 hypothetical protein BDZ99DRAFT_94347 [Mytilinidion resinicola]
MLISSVLFLFITSVALAESLITQPILFQSSLARPTTSSTVNTLVPSPTSKSPYLLPIRATPPDPLGIAQVSGFYGPGAWAAFILWISGSWYRLFEDQKAPGERQKIDANACAFLLATNCAAIDVLRRVPSWLESLQVDSGIADREKEMGSFGAAITIVWVGMVNSWVQSSIRWIELNEDHKSFRMLTLIIGQILPSSALATVSLASWAISGDLDRIPALYFEGSGEALHWVFFQSALSPGVMSVIAYWLCVIYFLCTWNFRLEPFNLFIRICSVTVIILIPQLLFFLVTRAQSVSYLYICFFPVFVLMSTFFLYFVLCFIFPLYALVTFRSIIFTRGRTYNEACFFMPCAPQSLLEMDQAFALISGIVLLLLTEIAPLVLEKRRERRKFEEEVRNERIDSSVELTHTGRAEVENLSRRTNSGISRQVV